ncbi:MAG: PQQ-binding-like beta-propeller repeat protein [Pirellulaceae bacterium]|nr:PQQ-binding-like beta-propeller repeat protein [Pirellulaceae bacterium]
MRILIRMIAILSIIRIAAAVEPATTEWRQFRGPFASGHATANDLPTTWGSFLEPYKWQVSIPGQGWSSPIVVSNRIWLTTAETTALPESKVVQKLVDNGQGITDYQTHQSVTLYAIEVDVASGKLLRKLELFTVDHPPPIHSNNSYASPTPISDGERLYCHFGSLGTVAVELVSGSIVWKKAFAVDDMTGSGSSPVLVSDRLILVCDGADEQFVVGLDKRTGEVLWKTDRPPIEAKENFLRRAFSTPLVIAHEGRTQLLAAAAQWLVSYDPETGAEWWRCRTAAGYSVVPQPAFHNGHVFVCTGYMKPELWAIRADGLGDVSSSHVAWTHSRQAPEIASPIIVDDAIYFVSSLGVLSCLDTSDGSLRWQHRLEGSYAASPIYADRKLYVTNQAGLTTVIQPGHQYTELAKNQLFGEVMASMAIATNALLLRTDPILYCIQK